MPLVVNSNISSLNAQRQLLNAGAELDKASERLASGKRINSAADDAAGLAISNRQTSQIRGLDQAIRNANDGISLIQTAEGALDESTNILQRMRELSVQSSNGIYSDSDRLTLDAEVQQLKSEITRIAESTSFNGKNILDGSLGKVELQVGALANQTVGFEIGKLDAKGLGGSANGDVVGTSTTEADLLTGLKTVNGNAATLDADDTSMTINGQSVGDLRGATTLNAALATINSNVSGVEVGAITELTATNDGTGIIRGDNVMKITVEGADGASSTFDIKDTGSMDELVDKINAQAKGQIEANLNDEGRLVLSSSTGAQIVVQGGTTDGDATNNGSDAAGFTTGAGTGSSTGKAQLTFTITDNSVDSVNVGYAVGTGSTSSADDLASSTGVQVRGNGDITGALLTTGTAGMQLAEGDLKINGISIGAVDTNDAVSTVTADGTALANAINKLSSEHGVVATSDEGRLKLNSVDGAEIKIELGGAATLANTGLMETNNSSTTGNSVADLDVSTQAGAQKAIDTIDKALEQINSTRSELGAVNNRLDFTVSNLSNVSENTSAARSRIVDADFAAESANLSRGQVLQQASQAMLAQANARPQQVLSLLQ